MCFSFNLRVKWTQNNLIKVVFVLNNSNAEQNKAIHVAVNGNDQNNGTKSKSFRILKKVASEAKVRTAVLFFRFKAFLTMPDSVQS